MDDFKPAGYGALWWFVITIIAIVGLLVIITVGPGAGHV